MQIIERPPLTSALRANSRATLTARRRSTRVIASCHAGVYGTRRRRRSPPATRPAARRARRRRWRASGRAPSSRAGRRRGSPARRGASPRRPGPSPTSKRGSATSTASSWRPCSVSTGSSVAEPQVPAALALLAVAEADRAVRHRRLARGGVEQRPASSRRARPRRRCRRPSGSGPARARRRAPRATTSSGRSVKRLP